ncbi:MAG: hypothetical protein H7A21_18110 [Spirochaetales bacterium]|nr:hypothetical protein [Leptospiraceae bacterium]MCP5483356.1 hypothetical protein [Spirochaetales bacterium]MCP5484145.1 hypothetical protein [Spirochaetales bacterium]
MKTPFRVLLLTLPLLFSGCPGGGTEPPVVEFQEGDLVGARGRTLSYVRGNLIDCRNTSVEYLVGDIRGDRTLRVWVNVMQGNIESGAVTVNILRGDIISGENVTVNLLIGEDFSGQAQVVRQIRRPLED